ncbi:hypothetical protein GCM10023336_18330 [Streptomyces similanensis]|uniref:Uncharacterized protein n=1 Tax=Streptomyces similanensis TaxID=1274988 RepID=A0ABP9K3D7_9ACTN
MHGLWTNHPTRRGRHRKPWSTAARDRGRPPHGGRPQRHRPAIRGRHPQTARRDPLDPSARTGRDR